MPFLVSKASEDEQNFRHRVARCPVCGSDDLKYAFTFSSVRLEECSECRLLFANPQPTFDTSTQFYREGRLLGDDIEGLKDQMPKLKRASAKMLLQTLKRYAGFENCDGKRLLDVGCAHGFLLAEAAAIGFDVTGFDFFDKLLEKAAVNVPKAHLVKGRAQDFNSPRESFDVVVLADVLEHISDPASLLENVHSTLKPGGIVLVATPSVESFSAWLMKEKWFEFKVEHLFYFRPNNLQNLLYRTGFQSITICPFRKSVDLDLVMAHFDRFPVQSSLGRFFSAVLPWVLRFLRRVPFSLSAGGMVAVATRRDEGPSQLKKLSIVMPVYNEKQTFSVLARQLIGKQVSHMETEIIIVESNSTDGTREEVLKFAHEPEVKVVLQDRPKGKGNAVREGLRHVTGDIVLIQDADLEYDIRDYDALLRPILKLQCSFTLGIRHKGDALKMRKFTDSFWQGLVINLGHKGLTFLFDALYRQRLKDPFTMYKVFRNDCIKDIAFECNHFDFDIELVIKLIKQGFVPVEIPVNYVSRSFSEGKKVSFLWDPLRIVKAMFKYWPGLFRR